MLLNQKKNEPSKITETKNDIQQELNNSKSSKNNNSSKGDKNDTKLPEQKNEPPKENPLEIAAKVNKLDFGALKNTPIDCKTEIPHHQHNPSSPKKGNGSPVKRNSNTNLNIPIYKLMVNESEPQQLEVNNNFFVKSGKVSRRFSKRSFMPQKKKQLDNDFNDFDIDLTEKIKNGAAFEDILTGMQQFKKK